MIDLKSISFGSAGSNPAHVYIRLSSKVVKCARFRPGSFVVHQFKPGLNLFLLGRIAKWSNAPRSSRGPSWFARSNRASICFLLHKVTWCGTRFLTHPVECLTTNQKVFGSIPKKTAGERCSIHRVQVDLNKSLNYYIQASVV